MKTWVVTQIAQGKKIEKGSPVFGQKNPETTSGVSNREGFNTGD